MADDTEKTEGTEADAAEGKKGKKDKPGFLNFKDPNLLPAAFIAIGLIVGGRLSAPASSASAEPAAEAAAEGHSAEEGSGQEHSAEKAEGEEHAPSSTKSGTKASDAPHWDYEHADEWGELSEDFTACVDGSAQSPIDIKDPMVIGLTDLRFAYTAGETNVKDTGHAIQADFTAGGTMTLDGVPFTLKQLHFHAPSEHTVKGKSFPAEVHLVHQAADGTLAVVGMMIEVGDENPVIAELWSAIPDEEGVLSPTAAPIDPASLLPGNRSAIRYQGSLTTPPCTEGVRWNLLVEPITMSEAQLEALQSHHDGNARPVQPTNGRPVVVDSGPDA